MNTLSIITAVHAPAAPYLTEAWQSIQTQDLPPGWVLEWIIQEDGHTTEVESAVPVDPRIRYRPGTAGGGVAIARNLALARCTGSIIKVLDADDQLMPGVLARDIDAISARGAGWSTSAVLDLLPDGSTATWDFDDPPDGILQAGPVERFWREHRRPPIHPATLAARRDLVDRAGGWMALPISEDTGLLLTLAAFTSGWFHSTHGLLYRKWPGQITNSAVGSMTADERYELIGRRIDAVQAVIV